jgi:hypothetical protein
MHPSDGANVISNAWRRIYCRLGARDALARVKAVHCDECSRVIRWWNRRVWLVHSERYVHLQCRKGQLFFQAFVADHIRSVQVIADENSALSRNRSPESKLQEPHTCAVQREQVERQVILLQPANEVAAKTGVDETQRNGNSSLRKSGEGLWHFLGRLAPHRSPRPLCLCTFCGAVEFSEKSVFCSKCGTPLRPSS